MPYINPQNIKHVGFVSDYRTDPSHGQARAIFRNDIEIHLDVKACECWEVLNTRNEWSRMEADPTWGRHTSYRYSPPPSWVEAARRRASPAVLDELAALKLAPTHMNKPYWCINLCAPDFLHEGVWLDLPEQREWLTRDLVFWNKAKAASVAETLRNYVSSQIKD